MDCMEAKALKSRIRGELAMKPTQQQALFDDFLCANGFACMPNEDFALDELLDFSFEELQDGSNDFLVAEEEDVEKDDNNSLVDDDNNSSNFGSFSASGDSGCLPPAEFSVPDDCVAELEWVSQFVDDSPSELPLLCPPERGEKMKELQNRAEPGLMRPICLPSWGPAKSRSKRPRIRNPVWFIGSPVSSTGSGGMRGIAEFLGEPLIKKAKKRPVVQEGAVQFERRCSHCGVQKTPQWRTGPIGPKTLCNACGVRFKSGRLFPEYRPACSPTFCSDVHSNSHRKVLEMRKKKELTGGFEPGLKAEAE